MRHHWHLVGIVAGILAAAESGSGTVTVPRGYKSADTELSISTWFGGFDYLADGRVIVSDSDEVFVLDGNGVRTVVASFETEGLFGSFVKVSLDGEDVYVGESSVGTISRFGVNDGGIQPIGPGTGSVIAEVPLHYDMEFDPTGRAFVSAATPDTWQPNRLLLLNLQSGETDLIARVAGYSGPLAFDVEGNLFYCTSTSYPPSAVESVIFFRRAQVDSAVGESDLTDADAEVFVSGIYGFSDMVFDDTGDLFGVTSSGEVIEVSTGGKKVISRTFASVSPNGATIVRFLAGSRAFEPYYENGGTLTFLESDFWSLFRLVNITPIPEFQVTSVKPEREGTNVRFATETGKRYQVYWSDDPTNGNGWQPCGPVVPGEGQPVSFLDAGDEQTARPTPDLARKRFYRVGIVQ